MNLSNPTVFDLGNARILAQASFDAYRLAPTLASPATDTQVRMEEHADHIIIAFRGSSSVRDFILDAEFFREVLIMGDVRENFPCAQVHSGFLKAFESVLEAIHQKLAEMVAGSRPIFVTGHSLGGALAILCALELSRSVYNIGQVITFGQPRVGNGDFKRLYDGRLGEQTFRVVNEEDIVARLPHLPSFHDPYRHVGVEVFLSLLSDKPVVNPSLMTLLLSDGIGIYRAWRSRGPFGAFDVLEDHKLGKYTDRLERFTL